MLASYFLFLFFFFCAQFHKRRWCIHHLIHTNIKSKVNEYKMQHEKHCRRFNFPFFKLQVLKFVSIYEVLKHSEIFDWFFCTHLKMRYLKHWQRNLKMYSSKVWIFVFVENEASYLIHLFVFCESLLFFIDCHFKNRITYLFIGSFLAPFGPFPSLLSEVTQDL